MINIEELQVSLKRYNTAKKNKDLVEVLLKREGESGRQENVGKFQNTYNSNIKIALQYREGGTNYWSEEILNKEFNKVIAKHFRELLSEAECNIEDEFCAAEAGFMEYSKDK